MADIFREIEAEIPRLRRYARALTREPAAADDLVQDCLTRALGKLNLWHDGTDLRAWLFTILHNQYVNHVRRSVREGAAVGLSESEPLLTRPPQQGQRLELRDLERAIAKLPEEQRAAILLVGLEGLRYEEVAVILDVPVGTVRSRLSRGRDALRRLVGIEGGEPGAEAAGAARPKKSRPEMRPTAGAADRFEPATGPARASVRAWRRVSAVTHPRRAESLPAPAPPAADAEPRRGAAARGQMSGSRRTAPEGAAGLGLPKSA